jgi:hypothetical protein
MLHRRNVDLVVLGVCANPLDEDGLALIVGPRNQPVLIALDIEDRSLR